MQVVDSSDKLQQLDLVTKRGLCRAMKLEILQQGDEVFREKDDADKLYIIIGGTCGVHIQQLKNLVGHSFGPEVAVLHSGHVFGENALFHKEGRESKRNATVLVKENGTLLGVLSNDDCAHIDWHHIFDTAKRKHRIKQAQNKSQDRISNFFIFP